MSKFSVSIPSYIYEQLAASVGKREVSGFIAQAVEEKLLDDAVEQSVEDFINLRNTLPKLRAGDIRKAMAQGRV